MPSQSFLSVGKDVEVIEKGARKEICSESILEETVQGFRRTFKLPSEPLPIPFKIPSRALLHVF